MALKEIENSDPLPVPLLLPLVVLLHDPDPNTCGQACVASANLITRGMATPFNDHLLERLLNLADTSPIVQVRVGAAIGLRLVAQSNLLDRETTQRCEDALARLAHDVSFCGRREATCPQESAKATD